MKPSLLAACLALGLLFGACSAPSPKASTPTPVITDTRPLGDGLKVIGFALLGASVVVTLGRLLR